MSFLIYMKQALSNLFKPPVTTSYPLKPKHFLPGDRGRVVNDISQCILCGQCMRTCPAGAITVDRKTGTWTINPFACVQCAGCVEVCPKKCLHMDPEAASPDVKKSEIILSVHQEEGTAKVERKVAAIAMTKNAMDDRSKIVNNIIKCIFCGQCMRNCPTGAITVDRRARTWRINLEACVNCGTCIDNCPRKCLSLGCYLGSPSEITLHGSMPPIRRKVAEVAPVAEGKAAVQKAESTAVNKIQPAMEGAEASPAVDLPDEHIRIEAEKCLFCGKCEHNCPVGAITLDRKNRTWTIDREKCITCGVCADGCPAHCLTLADVWEAGEKKESPATYQGKVLRRSPHRPAGVKVAEVAQMAPVTEGKAAVQKSDSAAVKKEIPGSKGAEGSLNSTAAQTAKASPAVDLPDSHIRIEAEKCLFCGKCEHNCPVGAITLDRKNRTWTIDREKCITCGVCADGCPAHCLTLADAWEAGEKKETPATYHGRVLRRPPHRPAGVKVAEVAKGTEGKAAAQKSDSAAVKKEVPGSKGAEGSLDSTAAQAAQSAPAVDLPDEHIRIEAEKCLFCGKCEHNCPVGAITLDRKNRTWTIDREKCITCGVCADGCPAHCLTLADAWEAGEKKESLATYQGKVLRRPPRRPAAPKVTESSEVAKAAKGKAVAHRSDGTEEVPGKDGSHA